MPSACWTWPHPTVRTVWNVCVNTSSREASPWRTPSLCSLPPCDTTLRTWRSSASSSVWTTWQRWPRLQPSGRSMATCSKSSSAEPAAVGPSKTDWPLTSPEGRTRKGLAWTGLAWHYLAMVERTKKELVWTWKRLAWIGSLNCHIINPLRQCLACSSGDYGSPPVTQPKKPKPVPACAPNIPRGQMALWGGSSFTSQNSDIQVHCLSLHVYKPAKWHQTAHLASV